MSGFRFQHTTRQLALEYVRRGMSLRQVARRLWCHFTTVGRWVRAAR